ncbi:hypothetical protein JHD50_02945 [Sulfurimonas sp. MAG313]|nr:hypothetical protein [Sulfurimonas sp. MAG313]MDF1880269.1 hypothetical protein [Sulfurimonas sp. MAG313]
MRRIVFLFIFLAVLVQAGQWSYSKEFILKKDEFQTITIKEQQILRVLRFRWTLFAGDGLVVHLNYNERSSQFVLYKHYKKDTYKVRLLPKKSAYKRDPYLYLVFKKYDYTTSSAYFDIFLDDPESRALVEVKPLRK